VNAMLGGWLLGLGRFFCGCYGGKRLRLGLHITVGKGSWDVVETEPDFPGSVEAHE
jgi:hypothetical protein